MDAELMLLTAHARIALSELETASGLTRAEIVALVEYGAFDPEGAAAEEWRFPASALVLARAAARLRAAFELDAPDLALVLAYVERVRELEEQVRALECRLPR